MRRAIALFLVLRILLECTALAAEAPPASPLLPFDHWAVKAAQRLYEVGLAQDWLPAQRAVPLVVVARTLPPGRSTTATGTLGWRLPGTFAFGRSSRAPRTLAGAAPSSQGQPWARASPWGA